MTKSAILDLRFSKLIGPTAILLTFLVTLSSPMARAAEGLKCEAAVQSAEVTEDFEVMNEKKEADMIQAMDQMMSSKDLVKNDKLRTQAKEAIDKIDALDSKITALRKQNGNWETAEITDKRMNALTFETFVMLDDVRMIQAHFGDAFAATERAAIRYNTSEAIISAYKQKLSSGKVDVATVQKLIDKETLDLELSKQEFLSYSDQTMSLAFVLKVMKETGSIIDVTTMFGSATHTTDIHGKVIEALNPDKATTTDTTLLAAKLPSAKARNSAATIQQRALQIDLMLGKYMKTEPVQQLFQRAQDIVGPSLKVERPTYEQLSALRERISPDWNSTDTIIARRKATLSQERKLRWKLRLLGPQLSEVVNNWLGSVDGKYRQALQPIARLAGLEYDAAVRRRHLAKILKVLSLSSPATQLSELLEGSSINPYAEQGELIVTFIRFTRARNEWNKIKALVENSEASYDQKLSDQFEDYENEAITRGPLPLLGPAADPVGSALAAGMGVGAIGLTGGAGTWLAEHGWVHVQVMYSHVNIDAMLHFVHLAAH